MSIGFTLSLTIYIARSGKWLSFQLEPTASSIIPKLLPEPLYLTSLSFISSSSSPSPFLSEISILSLNTSHVLLAGVTSSPSHPELAILLWDLQYSILLASQTLAVPSTLTRTKKRSARIVLSSPSKSGTAEQVLLALSPQLTFEASEGESRSSILVVPVSVPSTSTIANAMGKASAGAKWVAGASSGSGTTASRDVVSLGDKQRDVIKALRDAVAKNGPGGAGDIFVKYLVSEETREDGEGYTVLEREFVRRVLEVVLPKPGDSAAKAAYSARVVRELMKRRAISSGMVQGGLIPALLAQKDWVCLVLMTSAFRFSNFSCTGIHYTSLPDRDRPLRI